MAVYHQMGHQSDNLVDAEELNGYGGVILSPVNYTRPKVEDFIREHQARTDLEVIFDPQLYYPRTLKEKLRSWAYFPDDYETVDFSTFMGWRGVTEDLAKTARELSVHGVCSPAVAPRVYSDEYFSLTTQITEMLCNAVANSDVSVLQTVLIDLSTLADYERVLSIASIIAQSSAKRFYLVFVASEPSPRRELTDTEELKGAMLLINELKNNEFEVLVGFTCSDVLLWKSAGAASCATGKFWNTRRFNPGRWGEDTDAGNGHVAYLMEEGLIAFLRDSDVIRTYSVTSETTHRNPFYEQCRTCIDSGTAWVGLGWRQYLYWFYDFEQRFVQGEIDALTLLQQADKNWEKLEDEKVIMEERRNDGRWIRPWIRAISEYQQPWQIR